MESEKGLETLLMYQKKYGKRQSDNWDRWILRKRTINFACTISLNIEAMEFSKLEEALYFRCDQPEYKPFFRFYESAIEDAVINKDRFVGTLDERLLKMCLSIEKSKTHRYFLDDSTAAQKKR